MKKSLENLTKKDFIVFEDPTDGLMVEQPTEIFEDGTVLVCYLYSGYKSTNQTLNPEDIYAIGNPQSEDTIPGQGGTYDILQPEKLKAALEHSRD